MFGGQIFERKGSPRTRARARVNTHGRGPVGGCVSVEGRVSFFGRASFASKWIGIVEACRRTGHGDHAKDRTANLP